MNDSSPLLSAHDITKDFPGVRALSGVSFDVKPGEIHALVGENGAGKSTLIKILAGVYPHGSYAGELLLAGKAARFRSTKDAETAGIAVIHQELALVKHMSVGENIFLGDEPGRIGIVDFDSIHHESEKLLRQLGVDLNTRMEVAGLGVGHQQLVEIARAMRKKSRILVLDEPTAALAEHEVEALMSIMRDLRAKGTGLVYISHKLDEVLSIADRITVLRDGRTVASETIAKWTRESVVRAMVGRELRDMYPKRSVKPMEVVMQVRHLSVRHPELRSRMLLDDVSFEVRKGEILGVAGLMGAGRSVLLSTLFGSSPAQWTGTIEIGGSGRIFNRPAHAIRNGLAFVPEDRKRLGLNLMSSVLHNLSMAHLRSYSSGGVLDEAAEFKDTSRIAGELGIKTPSLNVAAETLSGGNQQKIVLGKWLLNPPAVLLLDEPTRGIDVGAKAEIYKLMVELAGRGMAVIMASSELPEILGMADRIVVLRDGRISRTMDRREADSEKIMEAAA